MENWLDRERALIGDEAVERLKCSSVLVFGVGGVGGYCVEALVRAGIGAITLVDHDTVNLTNLNRQIIATHQTLDMPKVEAAAKRIADINPECRVNTVPEFADEGNIAAIIDKAKPDYIIDAIDCVTSKLLIAQYAIEHDIPLIASMGTGNKLDPEKLKIADISKTHTCPLARVMRRELWQRGIKHLTVLFSEEQPVKVGMRAPASISFVPSTAGLMIAGYCIRKLTEV